MLRDLMSSFRKKEETVVTDRKGYQFTKLYPHRVDGLVSFQVDMKKLENSVLYKKLYKELYSLFGECNRVYDGKESNYIWLIDHNGDTYEVWTSESGTRFKGEADVEFNAFVDGLLNIL